METVTKQRGSQRGRPATGNALPASERMRAYRARKKAQVLEERMAAGLPPPRPGRPSKRLAKPAVADDVALARIAELEAANRKLADEVDGAMRSVAYHISEVRRLERELDARGTSLLRGKEPPRKHREDALTSWAAANPWRGKEKVKTLRTNVSRAISTIEDLTAILRLRNDARKLGYDLDLLDKAASVLCFYKSYMDNADAHAVNAKRVAENELKARADDRRAKMALKIFGTETPAAADVRAIASDLIAYHAVAEAWLKVKHRVETAFSSNISVNTLESVINNPPALKAEFLQIAIDMGRGSRHDDTRRQVAYWFGGWDDFQAWRATK